MKAFVAENETAANINMFAIGLLKHLDFIDFLLNVAKYSFLSRPTRQNCCWKLLARIASEDRVFFLCGVFGHHLISDVVLIYVAHIGHRFRANFLGRDELHIVEPYIRI